MHLLQVASMKINDKDKQNACDRNEWYEVLQVGNSTLHCQVDTGAYASVINTKQFKQVAPNAQIKQTNTAQHQINARFKDRWFHVNFYVIVQ